MSRSACLNAICELAKIDKRVVFIGSDLSPNTLKNFREEFPDRFFMEGINEQNCIGMAAGLALEGFIPYVNTIAPFICRRAYEQVALDICLHNLPVRLIANGGGLVYAPLGPTHIAMEDLAIMRAIPNMMVVNCSDSEEMKEFMPHTLNHPSPMYIRLGKDTDPVVQYTNPFSDVRYPLLPREGVEVVVISTGIMTDTATKVVYDLQDSGIMADIIHVPVIKPLYREAVTAYMTPNTKLVVTIEEGVASGGLGTAVMECLNTENVIKPVLRFGIPDAFPHHYGEQADLLETYGLTVPAIVERIKDFYAKLSVR